MTSTLKSAINGLSPGAWANQRAENLLETTRQRNPEIDLSPILKQRNIERIIVDPDLTPTARLEPEDAGFNIRLQKNRLLPTRGRFSVAHELGHTFFYNLDDKPPRRLTNLPYPDESEERLCNRFAAELLMPTNMVTSLYQELSTNGEGKHESILHKIYRMSNIFSVSLTTTSIRLVSEMELWDGIILKCRWLPNVGGHDSNSKEYAWRISQGVYNTDKYPDLFVPYPSTYVNGFPKIRWSVLDDLSKSMKAGEVKCVNVSRKELRKNGNLLDLISRLRGYNLFYSVGVMMVEGSRQGEMYKNDVCAGDEYDKTDLVFLISINFDKM